LCAVLHDAGYRISGTLALTPERIDLSGRAVMFESLKRRRRGVYRAVLLVPPAPSTPSAWSTASGRRRGRAGGAK
jgi:integrase/recombinase XerD